MPTFTSSPSNFLLATDATGAAAGAPVTIGSPTISQLAAVLWDGSPLAVLTGDTLEFRDASLAPIGQPFAFGWFSNGIRYSALHWNPSRHFGIAGTDTPTNVPVARAFPDQGCNAPQ